MSDILKVEHLNKSYKDFALTDVTFSLPEGCITDFIGANGAGKTTILRTILGLTQKDSGSIQIFGLDMERNAKQIKNRIGVVLDDGCFYEELSLAEMKSIISSAYTMWSEQDFKRYMDMLIMIDHGRIVFQEEKDVLLDNYRIVKGDTKLLTEEMRKLFLSVTETPFGFTGITKHAAKVQDFLSDVIIERPAIEDIMLANMGEDKK